MIFNKIIKIQRILEVDLREDTTLKKVMNLPSWDTAGIEIVELLEENDLPNIIDASALIDDNIVCFKLLAKWPDTIFHLQYFPVGKKVNLKVKHLKYYWLYHLFILLCSLPTFFSESSKRENLTMFILAFIALLLYTWILYSNVQSNVKHVEQELITRVNDEKMHKK